MNVSISKYTPKTETYGMTISLTDRVLISVSISNLIAKTYWEQVYFSLGLSMATETTSFLKSQDTFQLYREKYAVRIDIKSKRAKDDNNKIKVLMEQQQKGWKRGVTCQSGYALDSNDVPDYMRVEEMKKKVLFKVSCPFYGCFVKGHITNGAKKCRYNGVKHLGRQRCSKLNIVVLRGVTDSPFAFYELYFWENWFSAS